MHGKSSERLEKRGAIRFVFGLVAVVFSVIYFLEWRASRAQAKDLLRTATDAANTGVRIVTQAVLRNQALLERLQGELADLKGFAKEEQEPILSAQAGLDIQGESQPVPSDDVALDEGLPPLPPGTRGRVVLTADLDRLLRDEKLNPDKKELDPVTRLRAEEALTAARARSDVLESQIRLDLRVGMEKMRERGAFIQYGPGEKIEGSNGIMTAGEGGEDGGMRLYYYYAEEFPAVYERKREIEEVCEHALRQLLALLD